MTGCDPKYPLPVGKLKIAKIEPLSKDDSIDIEIIYPDSGSLFVTGWKEQNIKIINGDEIIAVSNLTIIGLKPGTALIKVNATTILSESAIKEGYEEKIYSAVVKVKVK